MRLDTSVAHTVNDECFPVFYWKSKMQKHSTWGVLSQGRNSKELTARETNGGTLGFNRRQRLKPYHYLYVEKFQLFGLDFQSLKRYFMQKNCFFFKKSNS